MPTMALKGNAACVVCTASTQIKNSISYETSESAKKVESYDRLEKAKKDTDDMFSVALKTGEDKESLVNRVTSAFSER